MGLHLDLGSLQRRSLRGSDMIIATFVSVLLLISGSNAQFQVGKCPTSKECDLKGGECFPKSCPRGFEKIGPCMSDASRGCVCCKPIIDVKCPKDPICEAKRGECQFPKCEMGLGKLGNVGVHFPANAADRTEKGNNLREEIHQFTIFSFEISGNICVKFVINQYFSNYAIGHFLYL